MNKDLGNKILFARSNESVIIPTKREEDGAFDLYANFEEDYIIIQPHETKMIPTGLYSAFSSDYVAILKERGSTGSKGIGQRAGVLDSGYRSEIFVPLTNHNNKRLVIAKHGDELSKVVVWGRDIEVIVDKEVDIIYPYEKAIAQIIMVEVPKLHIEEVTMDELLSYESERGTGSLGSSNK